MGKLTSLILTSFAVGLYFLLKDDGFDSQTIAGKRILVTGASSGLGEQIAYQYSKLGARLMIVARRGPLLEVVRKKCLELGAAQVEVVVSDLSLVEDRNKVIAEVEKRLGGLDHLILNHAIMKIGWWIGNNENYTDLVNTLHVNFLSYVDLASKSMLMLTESGGSIGVMSSMEAKAALPGMTAYAATKFALHGFFEGLTQELIFRNIPVSVTLAVIGIVKTDLGMPQQNKVMLAQKFWPLNVMVEPDVLALDILRAVATRQSEVYFGFITYVLVGTHRASTLLYSVILNLIIPDMFAHI